MQLRLNEINYLSYNEQAYDAKLKEVLVSKLLFKIFDKIFSNKNLILYVFDERLGPTFSNDLEIHPDFPENVMITKDIDFSKKNMETKNIKDFLILDYNDYKKSWNNLSPKEMFEKLYKLKLFRAKYNCSLGSYDLPGINFSDQIANVNAQLVVALIGDKVVIMKSLGHEFEVENMFYLNKEISSISFAHTRGASRQIFLFLASNNSNIEKNMHLLNEETNEVKHALVHYTSFVRPDFIYSVCAKLTAELGDRLPALTEKELNKLVSDEITKAFIFH